MTEVEKASMEEEREEDEELEEGELSSEDESAAPPPKAPSPPPKTRTLIQEPPKVPSPIPEPEPPAPQDDLESFMKKKMEEMEARVKSQLGPAAGTTASPASTPPPPAQPVASPPQAHHSSPEQHGDKDYRLTKDIDYRMMGGPSRSPPGPRNGHSSGSLGSMDRDYRHQQSYPERRRPLMEPEEDEQGYGSSKRRRRGEPRSPEQSSSSGPFGGGAGGGLLPPPPAAPSLPLLPEPTSQPQSSRSSNGSGPPERGPPRRGRVNKWGRPAICKFYREGYCRDGDHCTYSHSAIDSCRKPELCKFYQQGFCKKSLGCPFLHGEWPCKAFHKGECSKGDECLFSHSALDDFTRPIYEQMLRDEELASTIKLPPQSSSKRKTLLPVPLQAPGLPASTGASSANANLEPLGTTTTTTATGHTSRFDRTEHPNAYKASTSVAQPVFGSEQRIEHVAHPPVPPMGAPPLGLALPPPGLVTIQPVPVSHPGGGLLAPPSAQPLISSHSASLLPTPSSAGPTPLVTRGNLLGDAPPQSMPQPLIPTLPPQPPQPPQQPSYDIGQMLAKIKASVGGAGVADAGGIPDAPEEPEESPASPPSAGGPARAPTIIGQVQYRLVPCAIPCPPNQVSQELLNASMTDSKLANDPRIKKSLSAQFSQASELIGAAATAAANQAQAKAAARDPRSSASHRDPRKKPQSDNTARSRPSQPPGMGEGDGAPSYEEMVAMQLRMTAELAADASAYSPMPGPMLNNPDTAYNPPPTSMDTSNPGWMPTLSSGGVGLAEEESDLASLGLPVIPPLDPSSRYNLPGVKVRKLKSEG